MGRPLFCGEGPTVARERAPSRAAGLARLPHGPVPCCALRPAVWVWPPVQRGRPGCLQPGASPGWTPRAWTLHSEGRLSDSQSEGLPRCKWAGVAARAATPPGP